AFRAGRLDEAQREKRYHHADGRVLQAVLRATLVRDAEGEPQYVIVQVQDVTLEREATAELQAQRDLAAALLRSIDDGMVLLDGEARVLDANRRFCELVGYGPDEVLGATHPYPWWPEPRHAGGVLPASGCSQELDVELRRRDGTRLP